MFAFTLTLSVPGRPKPVKIGVPIGMTVAELEDQLQDRYPGWSIIKDE